MFKLLKFYTILLIFILYNPILVQASNNGNTFNYSWSEKIGYISMGGDSAGVDYGVTIESAYLSGYAWSEKTGWINFNDSGTLYAVINDGSGNLSGYAWSEKLGYISFDDSSANNYYQVTIDDSGNLRGYAWSEKEGYISMDDAGDLYKVNTAFLPVRVPIITNSIGVSSITSSTARLNGDLTDAGNSTTTVYIYWGDNDGGTATSSWDYEINLGEKEEGVFYSDISDLISATNYYYRCYAVNREGVDWAESAILFNSINESSPIIIKRNVILKERVILK